MLDFNVHALRARPPRRSLQLRVSEKPVEGSRLMCEKSVFPTGGAKEVECLRPDRDTVFCVIDGGCSGLRCACLRLRSRGQSVTCGKTTASEYGDLGNVDVLLFFSLRQASASLALAAMS